MVGSVEEVKEEEGGCSMRVLFFVLVFFVFELSLIAGAIAPA